MTAPIKKRGANIYTGFDREITIDNARNDLLTDFGKTTLKDRYLWKDETFQTMFARVAAVNSDNNEHAQRLYDYISKLWFMPATPVLSNSGDLKALPISCYLNQMGDSLEEIFETFNENNWLAARGGGIGTSFSELRPIGERVGETSKTSGIIPFIKMQDSATLGVSQGGKRRGSAAAYLDISHPEIEEFLEIRNPVGGDPERKSLNLHHAVVVTDAFMEAVKENSDWNLISPNTGSVYRVVKARKLWERILQVRLQTGEPYIWFVDNVNKSLPDVYKLNGLDNTQSNLCNEVALTTNIDYNGKRRTAVCCLSSVNIEKYNEWKGNELFIEDVVRFLDNVLTQFITKTDGLPGFARARYSAIQERSVGLGVMGFHGFLQGQNVPFESAVAKSYNMKIFSWLKEQSDKANVKLAVEKGSCPDAAKVGIVKRLSHVLAIAPTASISIIAGGASPCIEPWVANAFKQKTLSGWFKVTNKNLDKLLNSRYDDLFPEAKGTDEYEVDKGVWLEEQWMHIMENSGSVQDLDYLSRDEKDVYKTAYELDQKWIIQHAADRQQFICQGQSLNIFLDAKCHKKELNQIHFMAWKQGLKGLYYCRSRSVHQAMKLNHVAGEMPTPLEPDIDSVEFNDDVECLACQ